MPFAKLPKYETELGKHLSISEIVPKEAQMCIQETTESEYRTYLGRLADFGFKQYDEKVIVVTDEDADVVNLYHTYITEEVHVFLSWNASSRVARVIVQEPGMLPETKKPQIEETDTCVPCLIQPKLSGGMSYVIQLMDESFIVMDGGDCCKEDVQYLYELLKSKVPVEKKPVISAWMFTHPHIDHIGLAIDFLTRYAKNIEVHSFIYQFPDCRRMDTQESDTVTGERIEALKNSISRSYPSASHYTLHTGQTYYFKGVTIEILFDMEDIYPYKPAHYNDVSAAWRVLFDNGTTFLVLGDCFGTSCKQMADTYGTYLKSDIIQVTHHGLIGGYKELYQLIDPDVCFWPISEERFLGIGPYDNIRYCLGEGGCDYNEWIRDRNIREREHYHSSVTTVLEMN